MKKEVQILIGTILFIGIIIMVVFASSKEGFTTEDPAATKANEITSFMTTASEVLCPAYKGILEDKQRD